MVEQYNKYDGTTVRITLERAIEILRDNFRLSYQSRVATLLTGATVVWGQGTLRLV